MLFIDKSLGPSRNRITLTQGDSAELELKLHDKDGGDVTLDAADTAVLSLKKTIDDAEPVLQVKLDTESQFCFKPADTLALSCGVYWYDVEVTLSDGSVYTVIPPSQFILAQGVS